MAEHDEREPIPGEREADTLTKSERGVWNGANLPESDLSRTLDEETARQHEVEGGGAADQRSTPDDRA